MAVPIRGVEKLSTIDYPGKTCSIAFLAECNFRCPFCQNPDLIERPGELEPIEEEEFLNFVKSRRKWLDAVCVTGGEPCLHEDLPEFLGRIKEAGFLVKLDTNGTNPGMLDEIIRKGFVDYIAMDIKASQERYGEVARAEVDMEKVRKSVKMIMESGLDYEFRTTVVPGMHDKDEVRKIGEWIKGARAYYVQGFRPENSLDRSFRKKGKFSDADLEAMASEAGKFVEKAEVRY
jgi:pyruvate formate lyase activating enzyme